MNVKIDQLEKIHPVEAPQTLYAGILQKIQHRKEATLSPGFSYMLSAAAMLLLIINLTLMVKNTHSHQEPSNLAASMHLMEDNHLYK